MNQYFDLTIDGAAGADDVTLAAIAAINAIPERVTYEHKAIVEAARAAYNKIATKEQQALVTNYDVLISAEQRIKALTPAPEDQPVEDNKPVSGAAWLAWVVIVLGIAGVAVAVFFDRKREKAAQEPKQEKTSVEPETSEQSAEDVIVGVAPEETVNPEE